MNFRYFVILFLTTILFIHCSDRNSPPSIVIFIADDLGYNDLESTGNLNLPTPHIDRIASEGLNITNAHLTISQCSPSRISIISGRYPHRTGAEDLHIPMPDTLTTLTDYLNNQGYFTGLLRKSHLGEYGTSLFDWHNRDLAKVDSFTMNITDDPFMLWVGFTDPHRPYNPVENIEKTKPEEVTVPPFLVDNLDTRTDLAAYYDYIKRMDSDVGTIRKKIEAKAGNRDIIYIFFSDNGAPFPRAKGTVYDPGIKTPLFVSGPDIPIGTYDELFSMIDFTPTLLDFLGIDHDDSFDGHSCVEILNGSKKKTRSEVFMERNWHNTDEHIRAVRTDNHKLIENAYLDLPSGVASDIGKSPSWESLLMAKEDNSLTPLQARIFDVPRSKYELYDLNSDPDEVTNLIDDPNYENIKNELINKLNNWKQKTNDYQPTERRRSDNTDRYTGKKINSIRVPPFIQ